MRNVMNFNSNWLFCKTSEVPSAVPSGWESVSLPHTWNAIDGQDGGNDYWRGTAMYCKSFTRPELEKGGRAYLEIKGAANIADVYLNGRKLSHHEGGYSTFLTDLTDALEDENLVCVAVNNAENDYVCKADVMLWQIRRKDNGYGTFYDQLDLDAGMDRQ